jgi:ankyrin repeat protein
MSAPGAEKVVNMADNDFERTPLHIAVRNDARETATLLLKAGAFRDRKDVLGETPVDF